MERPRKQLSDDTSGEPVTMQMVAERAGLSRSAVSYALRNHPSIPEATRKRVQEIAQKMGYHRNAYVSTLMAQVHRKRITSEQPVIGWIVDEVLEPRIIQSEFYQQVLKGAQERAKELGYFIENFSLNDNPLSPQRLEKILKSRGIKGLIVGPVSDMHKNLPAFSFSDFVSSTIGYSLRYPQLHRVSIDYAHGMKLLWNKTRELGYMRPGLIISNPYDERTDHINRGIFMALQSVDQKVLKIPPCLVVNNGCDEEEIQSWIMEYLPDVIICGSILDVVTKIVASLPTSYEPAFFWINHELSLPIPGIQQPDTQIGSTAVDIVVNQIHRSEQGVPVTPNTTLIPYKWIDVPVIAGK